MLGKVVPDWWTSGWLNARYLARHLGAKIGGTKGWEWMATELAVGREGAVKIADGVELELHGQIDLVLAHNDAVDFAGQPAFGYSAPYPLATLQIDNDILEDKWALTHPALGLEKEEWETW
ncbi:MAG: hypothetical protein DMC60_12535 [Verrucomicrobia bacterium]|nr:MAG: hypothetical protein DMC60_12535 [Verrucomicrobiota bacterium]